MWISLCYQKLCSLIVRVSGFQDFRVSEFWRCAGHCEGAGEGRQEAWAAPASILSPSLLLPALAQWSLPQQQPQGFCASYPY